MAVWAPGWTLADFLTLGWGSLCMAVRRRRPGQTIMKRTFPKDCQGSKIATIPVRERASSRACLFEPRCCAISCSTYFWTCIGTPCSNICTCVCVCVCVCDLHTDVHGAARTLANINAAQLSALLVQSTRRARPPPPRRGRSAQVCPARSQWRRPSVSFAPGTARAS